jgi:hypothetical protein
MSEDGNNAVFVGTLLETGTSITVCPDCLLNFAMSIVESNTGLPIGEIIDHIQASTADGDVTNGDTTDADETVVDESPDEIAGDNAVIDFAPDTPDDDVDETAGDETDLEDSTSPADL